MQSVPVSLTGGDQTAPRLDDLRERMDDKVAQDCVDPTLKKRAEPFVLLP